MNILGRDISFNITAKKSTTPQNDKYKTLSKNDRIVIDEIITGYKDQSRKDIDKWKLGERMLEHPDKPRRHYLIDVFNDLKKDGHYISQTELRENTTLNTPFTIYNDDEVNNDATKFFNRSWFFRLMKVYLNSELEGHALVEFNAFLDNDVKFKEVPKRNVVPKKHIIIPDLSKEKYIDFEDEYFNNWMLEIGERENIGLINNIIPNLIFKRNTSQSWAEFCEKFGLPIATATTNDESQVDRIQYLLDQLGEAASAVFPVGTTIDLKEANRTDAYQTYKEFIQYNKEEISELIVGGTMVTSDGSSRSQSEVHERNLDKKIATTIKRNISFWVNDQLIPLLIHHGYKFLKENSRLSFDESHGLSLNEYWPIVQGIMQEHEIPEEFLSKTFYIPITGKKKILTPTKTNAFTARYSVDKCCPPYKKHDQVFIAQGFDFDREMEQLHKSMITKLWTEKDSLVERALITITEATKLINGLFTGWGKRRTQAAWNATDHVALHYMEMNLFEFAHSKTEARLASINELLVDKEKLEIRTYKQFEKLALEKVNTLNKAYLQTEYNLSVAVGQGGAAYHRALAEKDTVTTHVQYQTIGDSKVRAEHRLLDGKIFNLSDPEAMRLWPPNAFGCRCEMVQYIGNSPTVTKGKDAAKILGSSFTDSKFNVNRGDTKQVFTQEQFYSDNTKGLTDTNKLNYKDYDLKPYSELKQGLNTLKKDKTITKNNLNELFTGTKEDEKVMEFTDYLKRKIILKNKTFKTHTSGKYLEEKEGQRHQLFPFAKEALNNPSEVWLREAKNNKFQIRYTKVYRNETLVVDTEINNTGLEIKTWYPLKKDEGEIRKGLLIKGKDL